MGEVFTTLDLVIFFASLVGVMVVGLIAGRKEDTSEDYFLAGRSVSWWGVAGSIFGSNVSANHMVGMMGIGFSIGFAQSHFELGAIFGLMMLCYGFLPVYRKLNIYTLSEYLGRRYDERCRLIYAIIMVLIMTVVHMVPGLYIGARSICVLMGGNAMQTVVSPQTEQNVTGQTEADPDAPPKRVVNQSYYNAFVIALAIVAAVYTVVGGLKAILVLNPNSKENFFLQIVNYQGYLTPGLLVAFLVGMFWRRARATVRSSRWRAVSSFRGSLLTAIAISSARSRSSGNCWAKSSTTSTELWPSSCCAC